jgi:peptidoglycan/xylan/chitin deacetylase (PgdA/CDA1 family)
MPPPRRRLPAWIAVIGVLTLLLGMAWAVRSASDGHEATAGTATAVEPAGVVGALPREPPAQPLVTAERRAIARMSLKNVAVTNGGGREKLVALTFDDGPGPMTMQFLAVLNELGVPGTFYVQGGLVDRYPEVMRAIVAGGHEVGAHGWSHRELTKTFGDDFRQEVFGTRDRIREVAGVDPPTMRPPYGAIDDRVLAEAGPARMLQILWDVDTNDWRGGDAPEIAAHVAQKAMPGSIVLMHDGGTTRAATLNALPAMVRALQRKGIEFVTVSELMLRDPPRELRDDPTPADEPGVSTDGSEVSRPEPAPSSSASEPYGGE